MQEIWKNIKGFEGKYKVSNLGNVYSYKSHRNLSPYSDKKGYLRVDLFCNKGKRKTKKVHRLVAEEFITLNNDLRQINHIDKDPSNNNVNNLEWCTNLHNQKHSWENGRTSKGVGTKNGMAILNDDKVRAIRKMYADGVKITDIAKEFAIGRSTVYNVVEKRTWKHI